MPAHSILLVRHGQTEDNKNQIFQGQKGGPLNETGIAQARLLAARLASRTIASIVTSDLGRAVETATIVGDLLNIVPSVDPGLREIDVGSWSGVSYADVQNQFPEEYATWRTGADVRRGGGETYGELATRMRASLDRIVSEHEGTVICVSHGAALRALGCEILGLNPPGLFKLGGMRNTAISLVVVEDGVLRIAGWNDASHLDR